MASVREQVSWVTEDHALATEKAEHAQALALYKSWREQALYLQAQHELRAAISSWANGMVIEGVPGGMFLLSAWN